MSGQLTTYRNEIFNFLRTVTIKFEPFAWLMGEKYMDQYGITNPHGKWNPYYIHLSGNYTPEELSNPDKLIHVWSVENEKPEDIIFDKNTINTHPRTAALYRIPNKEYFTLEERYPEYVGLIRTIAYPISSIDDAIAAPNLSLLAYDASLLEENERESIITCLKNFLNYVKERWWLVEYTYENMYAVTFWSMLWQMLPLVLLDQRIRNIRTSSVHSFHIWEYLTSNGLKDYRDVLTKNQSLWLYRNLEYVKQNQGKEKTLQILAKELLGDAFVSLLYKNLQQNTTAFDKYKRPEPEIVSYTYNADKETKIEQIDDLTERLYNQELEHNKSTDYTEQITEDLGYTPYNSLNTKFLEFKKETIDTSGTTLMTNIYIDTLMYLLSEDKLSFNVSITEATAGISIRIYIGDVINLLVWSALRSADILPTKMFKQYFCRRALKLNRPNDDDLTKTVYYKNLGYKTKYLINDKLMLDSIDWNDKTFVTQRSFANWLSNRYKTLSTILRHNDVSNKYLYHEAMKKFWYDTAVTRVIDTPQKYDTWVSWYTNVNPDIASLITTYEQLNTKSRIEAYKHLATTCFDAIYETDESVDGATNLKRIEKIYTSIRDLFIQLCSYNITYLEAARDVSEYIRFRDPDFIINDKIRYNYDHAFDVVIDDFDFNGSTIPSISNHWSSQYSNHKGFRINNNIGTLLLNSDIDINRSNYSVIIDTDRDIGFDIDIKYKWRKIDRTLVKTDIKCKSKCIHLNFKINIDNSIALNSSK